MRNILVVALYPNESCPVFSLQLAKALIVNGYYVYAILPADIDNKSEWIDNLSSEKICFIENKKGNGWKGKVQKYTNIVKFTLLRKKYLHSILNIEFDIVFYTFFHRWNELLKRYVKAKRQILFVHDPIPHSDEKSNRKKRQKKQIRKMDAIVVLSKIFIPICEQEYNLLSDKILYMPHCLMNYGGEKRVFFDKNKEIHFLFFGRITNYKGLDILIKAFQKVEKLNLNAKLTIAGNGDFSLYEKEFSNLKNAFLINKYIEDEVIKEIFLQENTVCILPYIDATQSGVIPIAYEYGNPVIASDTGGLKEQLFDGEVGIFCVPNDVESLFDCMSQFVENKDLFILQSEKMIRASAQLNWVYATKVLLEAILL